MKQKQLIKIELTNGQLWLVARGLLWLTSSDDGADAIHDQFPSADIEALAADVGALLDKIQKAMQSRQDKITKIPGSAECDHRWENVQAVDVVCETCGVSQRTLTESEHSGFATYKPGQQCGQCGAYPKGKATAEPESGK